jgi:hypothetical protein
MPSPLLSVLALPLVDLPTLGWPIITTDGNSSVIGGHDEPDMCGSEAPTVPYCPLKQKL